MDMVWAKTSKFATNHPHKDALSWSVEFILADAKLEIPAAATDLVMAIPHI